MGRQKTVQKKLQPYEIGELDQYLFGQGTHYEIFHKMGAHKAVQKKQEGVYFAVWGKHNIQFSPEEITLILDLLKEGKSDAEKAQIDRTVNMAASMLKKKA